MRALSLCLIVLGILALAAATFSFLKFSNSLGISGPLLDQFAPKKTYIGEHSVLFEGSLSNRYLKVRRHQTTTKEYNDTVFDRMLLLSSLFDDTDSPYPDLLSDTIRCSDGFKPEKISHAPFDYLKLFATERFTYGACSWDLLSYRSILYFQPCADALYQLELFVPLGEDLAPYEDSIIQTRCKDLN